MSVITQAAAVEEAMRATEARMSAGLAELARTSEAEAFERAVVKCSKDLQAKIEQLERKAVEEKSKAVREAHMAGVEQVCWMASLL